MISRARIFAILAFTALALAWAQTSLSAERKALPVDGATKDASLLAFRNGLLDAIARRDADYVVKQAAVDIQLSFGGQVGREKFHELLGDSDVIRTYLTSELELQAAKRREGYWDALEDVLRMGGQFSETNVFEAPYTWNFKLPEGSDPFTTYFVIDKDAPLRDRPSKYGSIIHSLSYDIVTSLAGGLGTEFQKIELATGLKGFVHEDHLRSSIDYRAILKKIDGKWSIKTFVSGD